MIALHRQPVCRQTKQGLRRADLSPLARDRRIEALLDCVIA